MRLSDSIGELVAGLVALSLIGADIFLSVHGTSDSGLQSAVPVIVAFYFGGRVSTTAWQRRAQTVEDGNPVNGNGGNTA